MQNKSDFMCFKSLLCIFFVEICKYRLSNLFSVTFFGIMHFWHVDCFVDCFIKYESNLAIWSITEKKLRFKKSSIHIFFPLFTIFDIFMILVLIFKTAWWYEWSHDPSSQASHDPMLFPPPPSLLPAPGPACKSQMSDWIGLNNQYFLSNKS